MMRADQRFASLRPGETYHLPGRRPVWGQFVRLTAKRLPDNEWLFIASSGAPATEALAGYARRWETESLFGALKTRGFRFEDTHLTAPERIEKLIALLALVFAWSHRVSEARQAEQPIPVKKLSAGPSTPCSATASTRYAASSSTSANACTSSANC